MHYFCTFVRCDPEGPDNVSAHWYQPPPKVCAECGLPFDDGNHKRPCHAVFSGFGPGFASCELEEGHDGPHLLHPWDGSEWLVDDVSNPVQTRPSRYEQETT